MSWNMGIQATSAGLWRNRALLWVSPTLLLVVWHAVATAGYFPAQILVSPLQVLRTLGDLWRAGEVQSHLGQSLYRLGLGFAAGSLLGLVLGIAMGVSDQVTAFFSPLMNAMRQVPAVAFIPIVILIFGVGEMFQIVIVAKAALFPVALAAVDAVRGIPRAYFEVARVYRLPGYQVIIKVVLPATVPPVVTGLRLALSRSWMVLVAAELLAADQGIGQMMEMGRQMFRLDIVMVGVAITGLIGFSLDRVFRAAEDWLQRWQRR